MITIANKTLYLHSDAWNQSKTVVLIKHTSNLMLEKFYNVMEGFPKSGQILRFVTLFCMYT